MLTLRRGRLSLWPDATILLAVAAAAPAVVSFRGPAGRSYDAPPADAGRDCLPVDVGFVPALRRAEAADAVRAAASEDAGIFATLLRTPTNAASGPLSNHSEFSEQQCGQDQMDTGLASGVQAEFEGGRKDTRTALLRPATRM